MKTPRENKRIKTTKALSSKPRSFTNATTIYNLTLVIISLSLHHARRRHLVLDPTHSESIQIRRGASVTLSSLQPVILTGAPLVGHVEEDMRGAYLSPLKSLVLLNNEIPLKTCAPYMSAASGHNSSVSVSAVSQHRRRRPSCDTLDSEDEANYSRMSATPMDTVRRSRRIQDKVARQVVVESVSGRRRR